MKLQYVCAFERSFERKNETFAATVPPIKLNQLVKRPENFNGYSPHPRLWIENYIDAKEDNG